MFEDTWGKCARVRTVLPSPQGGGEPLLDLEQELELGRPSSLTSMLASCPGRAGMREMAGTRVGDSRVRVRQGPGQRCGREMAWPGVAMTRVWRLAGPRVCGCSV